MHGNGSCTDTGARVRQAWAGPGPGEKACMPRQAQLQQVHAGRCGQESMGMPRQVHVGGHREGCRGTGGHMQVTIVNTSRKKRKEKLTYWHRQAGMGTGR